MVRDRNLLIWPIDFLTPLLLCLRDFGIKFFPTTNHLKDTAILSFAAMWRTSLNYINEITQHLVGIK